MKVLNRKWWSRISMGVLGTPTWDAPETRVLASQACFDCHSNETEWPRSQEEAKEAPEEVLEGEMPPAAYKLIHAHARLHAADRDRLAQGLARTLGVPPEHEAREPHR